WRTVTPESGQVEASNGCLVATEAGLEDVAPAPATVARPGPRRKARGHRPALPWPASRSRPAAGTAAVCTGSYVLARAGLLEGRRCTIHWENQAAFAEEFPETALLNLLYVTDEGIFTCAGGTAAADMMLHLIAEDHGAELASSVADSL